MGKTKLIAAAIAALVVALLIGAVVVRSNAEGAQKPVVKTVKVKGRTLLANKNGRTLYHLSVERRGHFICTDMTCLSIWKPLVVARGAKPTGVRSLATVKRPDGRLQVAYKGEPLYTFTQDRKTGDTKGDGFRDVGIWRVAVLSGASQAPAKPSGGYGYGY